MIIQKTRLIHLSDPHFGTSLPKKIIALIASIHELRPDQVLMSGDITQRAYPWEFRSARKFCEALKPYDDVLAVPGNHDIPLFNFIGRLFWPYHGFNNHFKHPTDFHKKIASIEIMGLNSTDRFRHIQGDLGYREMQSIQNYDPESLFRVAVVHHPMDCAQSIDEKNLLKQASQILPAFEKEKIDLVLSGHIHDPLARLSICRYPHAQRPMILALAGTCLSSRTRFGAPNSFNVIDINIFDQKIQLSIERYDIDSKMHFKPWSKSYFERRDRDSWVCLEHQS